MWLTSGLLCGETADPPGNERQINPEEQAVSDWTPLQM